ncbi:UDP-2,4-diacetamido-2,4,6-trideoxy-beta-L-altropyranose hydrolase [Rheinheimera baltica]|uniref:UDP-2,4-diacetamido-2,4, 6-trideoxy-beta-L-altropyranose hydrolase n=1 Tax=Rheinheimera baltica TaxID=67576 RepID=UPI00273FC955|nr:UDP-2,4-diacetamido-2,4,6-trideoxy-beta-L-altropyranose hydrolase [Rheinheimera baltica]MDP5149893.1 UDP-2,4-diacetamido-2,4,6-trideoxy-beta-L-altropyranose hydrolase [Rheinheimera baltica]
MLNRVSNSSSDLNIVFRLDSSSVIGFGHLMRSLTLAAEFKQRGANCFFICRDLPGNNSSLVIRAGFELLRLPIHHVATTEFGQSDIRHHAWLGTTWLNDINQCTPYFRKLKPVLIVVDHYALGADWETRAKFFCQRLAVIDDLADRRHECDFLLDYNLSVSQQDYSSRVEKHCLRLFGGKYVLLRQEFANWRSQSIARRKDNTLSRILVTFGATDSDNNSEQVLKVLNAVYLPALTRIDVVISSKAPWLASVRAYASTMAVETHLHTDISNMAELITAADLAIGSGGGSTYERLFLKLPSLLMPIADNQITPLQRMSQDGLFELFYTFDELWQKLMKYHTLPLPKVSASVLFGAPFVSALLLAETVTLADVKPWDVRRNYHWLQQQSLRQQFVLAAKPERSNHIKYWRHLLAAPEQYVFSILSNRCHVGSLGVKNIDEQAKEAEIWIYLGHSDERNRGVGSKALLLLEEFVKQTLLMQSIVLHVAKDNTHAQSFYYKHHYRLSNTALPDAFKGKDVLQMRKKL